MFTILVCIGVCIFSPLKDISFDGTIDLYKYCECIFLFFPSTFYIVSKRGCFFR